MVKLTRIAPELPVANLQLALEYYADKLGFKAVMQMPNAKYAVVERDDIAIHLFQDDAKSSATIGIHIFTHDLETLYAELQQRGTHISQGILSKPWGNRDFRVHDDSGNEIKFTDPA